jgi:monovalent cation:proton antiporter-2 (CPA2) family protein
MHEESFIYQAFVYLCAAVVAVPIAKKMGLGSVLGYLLAGIIIGPFALGLVGEEGQDVLHFAEFGVVMMLFLIGLELQPAILWKMRIPILGFGGIQVLITTLIITILAIVLVDLAWQTSLAIGLSLALSSTAIAIQTLSEKGLLKTEGGQNAFSVLLFQDIAVIPILAILPFLAVAEPAFPVDVVSHGNLIEDLPIVFRTLIIVGLIGFIFIAGKYLMAPAFRIIAQTRLPELFTAAALLLVVGITLAMTQVGLSPALGTFLAGVVLAQNEYRHELEANIAPFKGLLLGLFFIAIGASLDFELIINQPLEILALTFILLLIKLTVLLGIGRFFKMSANSNFLFSFSLAQGGEFAFVLFSYGLQNGVMSTSEANPLIAAVVLSMALTPVMMLINERVLQPRYSSKSSPSTSDESINQRCPVIIAGFGRYGSTIGRFLQANGIQATYLDTDPANVELLRKMGLQVYYGDASRQDLMHAAGAETARLLIIAVDDPAKTLNIVDTAQKHFPHLKIISRSKSWDESYDLLDRGIDKVFREYLDTSLYMAAEALSSMGVRKYQVQRALKLFRKHDEHFLRQLADLRHEQNAYISSVREHINDLQRMLQEDQVFWNTHRDAGWDATSRKEDYLRKN